jgi:phosphatidylinositol-3-phosphatase
VSFWRRAGALALMISLLVMAACTDAESGPTPSSSFSPSKPGSARPRSAIGVEKVLVIVEENRSVQNVAAHMPFLMSKAKSYGTASEYYAVKHPSLPNYLVLAGGSTFGVSDDANPDVHRLRGPSLFGRLLDAGHTAKTYAEAMPSNCALRNHGSYAVRHNPWTYFDDRAERAACERFDVPLGSPTSGALADDVTAGKLPTFGLVIPDSCSDGHDCSAATTDDWLRSWLPTIEKGHDFTSNQLVIVVAWDEDDRNSGNRVQLVVIHPSLQGKRVTSRLDHYGLSASIARMGGIRPLREADKSADVLAAFGFIPNGG